MAALGRGRTEARRPCRPAVDRDARHRPRTARRDRLTADEDGCPGRSSVRSRLLPGPPDGRDTTGTVTGRARPRRRSPTGPLHRRRGAVVDRDGVPGSRRSDRLEAPAIASVTKPLVAYACLVASRRGHSTSTRRRGRPVPPSATCWPTPRACRSRAPRRWPRPAGAASTATPASTLLGGTLARRGGHAVGRLPGRGGARPARHGAPPSCGARWPRTAGRPSTTWPGSPAELLAPTLVGAGDAGRGDHRAVPGAGGRGPGPGQLRPQPVGPRLRAQGGEVAALDRPGRLAPHVRPLRRRRARSCGSTPTPAWPAWC